MAQTPLVSPIRGAVRTVVSTSTDTLVAGQEFSIFVTVQNPFEVPLTLHRVSTYLPAEFVDVGERLREVEIGELQEEIEELRGIAARLGIDVSSLPIGRRRSLWARILPSLSRISLGLFGITFDWRQSGGAGPAIARDMGTLTTEVTAGVRLPLVGMISQTLKKEIVSEEDDAARAAWKERVQQELDRYQRAVESLQALDESATTMQPGNSTTRTFTVRSRRTIRFRPSTYKLNIEAEYEIGGVRNLDTIEHVIHVRGSMVSMVLGALLGGVAGWLTSKGPSLTPDLNALPSALLSFGTSILLAMITVVLLARKTDVQPLISIEDFWGGIAVGFLVAYSGPKLVEGLIA